MAETFQRQSLLNVFNYYQDAYQCPNAAATNRAIVLSCLIANVNGAGTAASVTVAITDSGNNVLTYQTYQVNVPSNAALETIANKLVLKNGEKIRILASANSILSANISVLELT